MRKPGDEVIGCSFQASIFHLPLWRQVCVSDNSALSRSLTTRHHRNEFKSEYHFAQISTWDSANIALVSMAGTLTCMNRFISWIRQRLALDWHRIARKDAIFCAGLHKTYQLTSRLKDESRGPRVNCLHLVFSKSCASFLAD